jgi:hypothetical protein
VKHSAIPSRHASDDSASPAALVADSAPVEVHKTKLGYCAAELNR